MEQPALLLAELARIQQLAKQMESQLHHPSAGESCKPLLQMILSSVQSSILIAKFGDPAATPSGDTPRCSAGAGSETSKVTSREETKKKRKTLPKWSSEVRVGAGAAGGLEGPVDDGFSWRKYGQKGILGAKNPRGYYRCTHRTTMGCPATKQVQLSDEDPLLFHVTYYGNHTCLSRPQNKEPQSHQDQRRREQQQEQQGLSSFQAGLKVETEGFSSFAAGNVFGSPSASLENNCFGGRGGVGPSPAFPSPTTSDSIYFSISPHGFEGEMKLWSPESGANSAADSPAVDMDLLLQELDFERDLSTFFS